MIMERIVKKKPIAVKCVQFTKDLTDHELRTWSNRKAFITQLDRDDEPCVMINTLEGTMKAQYGDWIMIEFDHFWIHNKDLFKTYCSGSSDTKSTIENLKTQDILSTLK
jgi:hypothetical protein